MRLYEQDGDFIVYDQGEDWVRFERDDAAGCVWVDKFGWAALSPRQARKVAALLNKWADEIEKARKARR